MIGMLRDGNADRTVLQHFGELFLLLFLSSGLMDASRGVLVLVLF